MVQINFAKRIVNFKIVYYGAGVSGRTTNLEVLNKLSMKTGQAGPLTSISVEGDGSLFFDLADLAVGRLNGMNVNFQIYTVPGACYYNSNRKLILQGVDGIVFVVDSQKEKMEENIESFHNLVDNLREQGRKLSDVPHILQFNKRDLANALPLQVLENQLNTYGAPAIEAVAVNGTGVFATAKLIARMVVRAMCREFEGLPLQQPSDFGSDLASLAPDEALAQLQRRFRRAPLAERGALEQLLDTLDRLGSKHLGKSAREWALDLMEAEDRQTEAEDALGHLGFSGEDVLKALRQRAIQAYGDDLAKVSRQGKVQRHRSLERLLRDFSDSWDIPAWKALISIGGPQVTEHLENHLEQAELMLRAGAEDTFILLARAFLEQEKPDPETPSRAKIRAIIDAHRVLLEGTDQDRQASRKARPDRAKIASAVQPTSVSQSPLVGQKTTTERGWWQSLRARFGL